MRFVSSVCLLVRVTMVDKNKAVVCCSLTTSAIMLSEKKKRKRKMWSKWYLKRNISCDGHLLNELLETECFEIMPSWCRQVNWGNCGSPFRELCSFSVWRTTWKGSSEPCLIACKTAHFTHFFPSGMTSLIFSVRYDVTLKSLSLTESV